MLREKGVQCVLFFSGLVAHRQETMSRMVAHHKASVPRRSWIFLVRSKKRLSRSSARCSCSHCEGSWMFRKNWKRMLPHQRSHLARIQWKNSLSQSCGKCPYYQDCYCCSFSFGSWQLFISRCSNSCIQRVMKRFTAATHTFSEIRCSSYIVNAAWHQLNWIFAGYRRSFNVPVLHNYRHLIAALKEWHPPPHQTRFLLWWCYAVAIDWIRVTGLTLLWKVLPVLLRSNNG